MSCCGNKPTAKATALAQNISWGQAGNMLDWLVERFGPALSEVLLDLLTKKSIQGVAADGPPAIPGAAGATATLDAFGGFDVKNLVLILLEKFGPALVEKLADQLDQREDVVSKVAAQVLRQYAPQLVEFVLGFLKTSKGEQVFNEAVAKVLAAK